MQSYPATRVSIVKFRVSITIASSVSPVSSQSPTPRVLATISEPSSPHSLRSLQLARPQKAFQEECADHHSKDEEPDDDEED